MLSLPAQYITDIKLAAELDATHKSQNGGTSTHGWSNYPESSVAFMSKQQRIHSYNNTLVTGNATAILGDKHEHTHNHGNNFQIQHATFFVANSVATDSVPVPNVPLRQNSVETIASQSTEDSISHQDEQRANEIGSWLVPLYERSELIGRSEEIQKVESLLYPSLGHSRIALEGLGGVGKTRLALELATRKKQISPCCSVFWVQCTDISAFERDYRRIGNLLGIQIANDPEVDVKSIVRDHLSHLQDQWLLILDNADEEALWLQRSVNGGRQPLTDFIPKSKRGTVLVTTRNHRVAVKIASKNVVKLSDLTDQNALTVLKSLLIRPELLNGSKATSILLERVTNLPLALVQAAAYINENDLYCIEDYLQLWNTTEEGIIDLLSEDFEDEYRYSHKSNAVATTWWISFEQIRQLHPLAEEVLAYMACLDFQSIPRSILPLEASPSELNKAFGTLTGYALIQPQQSHSDDVHYDVHRLVHLATRNWLRRDDRLRASLKKVARDLCEKCSWTLEDAKAAKYLPHAVKVYNTSELYGEPERINLMDKVARYFEHTHQFARSVELLQLTLHWREEHYGLNAAETIDSRLRLGWALSTQGRFKEAELLLELAIAGLSDMLGKDNARIFEAMTFLTNLYRRQGRLIEAEEISLKVIETSKKTHGPEDEFTLTASLVLCWIYRDQRKWTEAENLLKYLRDITRKQLSRDDYRIFKYDAELALVLARQGRLEEAQTLQEIALHAYHSALGEVHPDTLQISYVLAITYRNLGRLDDAERLFKRNIEIEGKLKREDDFNLIMLKSSLAKTYYAQHRYREAGEMQECLITKSFSLSGQETQDTLLITTDLAQTRYAMGMLDEAMNIMKDCVKRSELTLGMKDPTVLERRQQLQNWQNELWKTENRSNVTLACEPLRCEEAVTLTQNTTSNKVLVRKRSSTDEPIRKRIKIQPRCAEAQLIQQRARFSARSAVMKCCPSLLTA